MYYLKRLFQLDFKRMFLTIDKIAKRSHKNKVFIIFDIFITSLLYGSGYMDYFQFYFEDLSFKQRSTYINRTVNNQYFKLLNNREYYHFFHNKQEFLKKFKQFIKRDFVMLKECSYEDYEAFVSKHPTFMAKPNDGLCGHDIELINTKGQDLKVLYDSFMAKNTVLLEERIIQDASVSSIYPEAINTLRVVTINHNGHVDVPFVALRIGNGGRVVDNFNSGGMFTVVDSDGIIRKPAIDKENRIYEIHPYTGTKIVGFEIPHFKEVIEQCKQMATVIPEVGYVGWDMAITKEGIDVVEGNQLPGYDIYQSLPHLNADRCGLKPRFDEIIYHQANK